MAHPSIAHDQVVTLHGALPTTRSSLVAVALVAAAMVLPATKATAQRYYGADLALSGNNVVPPNSSGAYGYGTIRIDTQMNQLQYDVTLVGVTGEIESHIHGFAPPGQNAPVVIEIPTGDHKVDVWNYIQDQEADILAGRAYVVVHTFTYPGGELRGQIVPSPLSVSVEPGARTELQLAAPTPNPSHGAVDLEIDLPRPTIAQLSIVDAGGRRIASVLNGPFPAGAHRVRWDGRDANGRRVPAGLLWAVLDANGERRVRKWVVAR